MSFEIFSFMVRLFPAKNPYGALPSNNRVSPAANDNPSICALFVTSLPATNLTESYSPSWTTVSPACVNPLAYTVLVANITTNKILSNPKIFFFVTSLL